MDKRYSVDFSLESNIRDKLLVQMLARSAELSAQRESVKSSITLDELNPRAVTLKTTAPVREPKEKTLNPFTK